MPATHTMKNFLNLYMTICELNKKKIPIIKINKKLNKYSKMPLFQEKVDKANEMLRTVGLPDFILNAK